MAAASQALQVPSSGPTDFSSFFTAAGIPPPRESANIIKTKAPSKFIGPTVCLSEPGPFVSSLKRKAATVANSTSQPDQKHTKDDDEEEKGDVGGQPFLGKSHRSVSLTASGDSFATRTAEAIRVFYSKRGLKMHEIPPIVISFASETDYKSYTNQGTVMVFPSQLLQTLRMSPARPPRAYVIAVINFVTIIPFAVVETGYVAPKSWDPNTWRYTARSPTESSRLMDTLVRLDKTTASRSRGRQEHALSLLDALLERDTASSSETALFAIERATVVKKSPN